MRLVDAGEIDDWLAGREAGVENLRQDCAKRVVWHGAKGVRTPISVVYVHGFSASSEELRPMPDLVAKSLGANLFFTRLTGHGQDGAAMGRARLEDWAADLSEAFDVGLAIGDAVIVIGCSTGAPLITLALAGGRQAKGVVFVSPNFGLRHVMAQLLLDLPGARRWGHYLVGPVRSFDPVNDAHAAFWTTQYPTQAVYPMGDAVRAARRADVAQIKVPVLCALNAQDQVISPRRAAQMMARWGGPVTHYDIQQTGLDDPMGHLMAGDVFSPRQTGPMVVAITNWANRI